MSAKLAWSATGILAIGHGELLDLWQIGDRIRPVALAVRPPIGGAVAALAFDAPGERLAVAIARDPAVAIRSLARGTWTVVQTRAAPLALGYDDDAALLAFSHEAGLWRIDDGALLAAPRPLGAVWAAALLPRHRRLLVGRDDLSPLLVRWGGAARYLHDLGWTGRGASSFCVSVNRAEDTFAMGGKHSDLLAGRLAFDGDGARATLLGAVDLDARVVACTLHPTEPLAAAQALGGRISIVDLRLGRERSGLGEYQGGYPPMSVRYVDERALLAE